MLTCIRLFLKQTFAIAFKQLPETNKIYEKTDFFEALVLLVLSVEHRNKIESFLESSLCLADILYIFTGGFVTGNTINYVHFMNHTLQFH